MKHTLVCQIQQMVTGVSAEKYTALTERGLAGVNHERCR